MNTFKSAFKSQMEQDLNALRQQLKELNFRLEYLLKEKGKNEAKGLYPLARDQRYTCDQLISDIFSIEQKIEWLESQLTILVTSDEIFINGVTFTF